MTLTKEKRAQIIEAAVSEFQELGFAGASMDRVAARADVSKRTVYNHFESKEALFRAILDLMAGKFNQAFHLAYDPALPIEEQLHQLGWAEGQLLTSPDFMKLARIVVSETMRDPELAAEMNRKMERVAAIREMIEAAAEAGVLDIEDAALAAEQFLGLIKTQAFWPVIFSGEVVSRSEMERIVDSTVTMFLRSYSPD